MSRTRSCVTSRPRSGRSWPTCSTVQSAPFGTVRRRGDGEPRDVRCRRRAELLAGLTGDERGDPALSDADRRLGVVAARAQPAHAVEGPPRDLVVGHDHVRPEHRAHAAGRTDAADGEVLLACVATSDVADLPGHTGDGLPASIDRGVVDGADRLGRPEHGCDRLLRCREFVAHPPDVLRPHAELRLDEPGVRLATERRAAVADEHQVRVLLRTSWGPGVDGGDDALTRDGDLGPGVRTRRRSEVPDVEHIDRPLGPVDGVGQRRHLAGARAAGSDQGDEVTRARRIDRGEPVGKLASRPCDTVVGDPDHPWRRRVDGRQPEPVRPDQTVVGTRGDRRPAPSDVQRRAAGRDHRTERRERRRDRIARRRQSRRRGAGGGQRDRGRRGSDRDRRRGRGRRR